MNKNLIVGQSGGPTAVINSSLYGVVKAAIDSPEIDKVFGMENGIEGFLLGNVLDFQEALEPNELELLKSTPGAYLGSCRFMLPEDLDDPVYPKLFEKLNELNIGYFMYNGGNDSMDTVSKVSRYAEKVGSDIKVMGIPKTIDNDLVLTDHTPGFASAAKYVANTVREIVTDASVYETPAVTIIEIMGRHAGWLTAASALARRFDGDCPDLIYLPEVDFDCGGFVSKVKNLLDKKNTVVVCISEGINDAQGKFICEYDSATGVDNFGHKMLAGAGKYLENLLRSELGCKARSVEFNVSQRCSSALLSKTDRDEAVMAGEFGVKSALAGETGYMVAFDRVSDYEIECSLQDVNEICNKEKKVPSTMISADGTDVTDEFINYCKPLILGNVEVACGEDGLPKFAYRK